MHFDPEEEWGNEIEQDWLERLELKSVGIDIGSSTSHLMFSRLVLARRGREYFSGYTVVGREVVYRSPILLTPYADDLYRIDTDELASFIKRAYAEAGMSPDDIDTGAVIITGEAAKKENAAAIINLFAEQAGKFVCATAGPNLEAALAAHGSGAVRHSLKHKNGDHYRLLNVDVGGGTAKLAVVYDGRVLETSAINVGARLFAWDERGVLVRVEEPGRQIAAALGIEANVGRVLSDAEKTALARQQAKLLFEVVGRRPLSPLSRSLMITPELTYAGPVDLVVYSGGVAEFIYGVEHHNFGDLGPWLGRFIREEHELLGIPLGMPDERIRATVIGASQYTVQVSGNTIFVSSPDLLPLRNLPVVILPPLRDPVEREQVAEALERGLRLLDLEEGARAVAIAIKWEQPPAYPRLLELAAGLRAAMPRTIRNKLPLVLLFDNDVAKLIGHILTDIGVENVVSVDSIDIRQLSYVDIGKELADTKAVPVTVKSLIFG